MFLGTVGSRAGDELASAMSSPRGAKIAAAAVIVVAFTAAVTIVLGRRVVRLGGARLAGTIAGLQTQPAVLAFANDQTGDERVGTSYALLFPIAMLLKIVLAQFIVLLWQ